MSLQFIYHKPGMALGRYCSTSKAACILLLLQVNVISAHRFPDGFLFGAATAAYQIEGGWDADDKSPSIWDDLMHERPEVFAGNETSDIGCDSYHQFEQDISALRETGFDFYRFSISWSRVMPDAHHPSEAGLAYYDRLIDRLLSARIRPMVTIYHYDLPARLQTIGGWTNPEIRRHFVVYARLLFQRFGSRVQLWITVNEPFDFCVNGYGSISMGAPMQRGAMLGAEYLCVDNVLKAHAMVYQLYKRHYSQRYGGKVGITLSSKFFYDAAGQRDERGNEMMPSSVDDDEDDDGADDVVDRAMQFELGWLANALFSADGYYPDVVVQAVAANSARDQRAWSRLPKWSPAWRKMVRGSVDFLGLNYYTSRLASWADPHAFDNATEPSMNQDRGLRFSTRAEWKRGESPWLFSVPQGLGDILRWIRDEYDNPEVMITENGWSDRGELVDRSRVLYYCQHLKEVAKAIVNDGCNVTAYTAWSIIDNFEWLAAFTERFGLYGVDLQTPNRQRRRKLSAEFFQRVIRERSIPDKC